MFIDDDFLLDTPQAKTLFHDYAEHQPIIDYHSHLDAAAIADNRQFSNIAQLWLDGDHYKWRAMRTNGIPERLCSGDAPDREKYDAWAATVPRLLRNPLYHWTHLELRRPSESPEPSSVRIPPEISGKRPPPCSSPAPWEPWTF